MELKVGWEEQKINKGRRNLGTLSSPPEMLGSPVSFPSFSTLKQIGTWIPLGKLETWSGGWKQSRKHKRFLLLLFLLLLFLLLLLLLFLSPLPPPSTSAWFRQTVDVDAKHLFIPVGMRTGDVSPAPLLRSCWGRNLDRTGHRPKDIFWAPGLVGERRKDAE